jgi:predicted DCC family thiol-disulfide oxidoreductase YuxK
MPTPLSTRLGAPIAFVPASRLPEPELPAALDDGPVATPERKQPPAGLAFKPAGAAVDVDALLDRFEGPTSGDAVDVVGEGPAAREVFDRPILLFNGQCETCKVLSAWVKKQDAKGEDLIDERPIPSKPEALARLNPDLDLWTVHEDIHLLLPDGTVKKGGEAIAEVLKALPNTGWYTWAFDVSVLGMKPGLAALQAGYKVLDAIRPALGCTSCGGGPVVWWAKPIKWTADAIKWVLGVEHKAPDAPIASER